MNEAMSPLDWVKRPIQKYADFSGRAPRAEYWWYTLALVVVLLIVSVIENILGLSGMIGGYGPLSLLLTLGLLIPGVAVSVRRLHDTDRSAWWLLLMAPYVLSAILAAMAFAAGSMAGLASAGVVAIVALLCAVAFLVLMVLPGTPGSNRYGPSPYGEAVAAAAAG